MTTRPLDCPGTGTGVASRHAEGKSFRAPCGGLRTRLSLAVGLGALLLIVLPVSGAYAGGSSSHPYFNDGGALTWYTSYAEARQAAQREGKLIFIEYGRLACTNCRKLATDVLARSSVGSRLGAVCVGLAAECDRPEREVSALLYANLSNPRILPFVGIVTPSGQWVTGFFGGVNATAFEAHLAKAERIAQRMATSDTTARTPTRPAQPSRSTVPAPAAPLRATSPQRAAPPARVEPPAKMRPSPVPVAPASPPSRVTHCAEDEALPQSYGSDEPGEHNPDDCCPGGNCAPPDCDPYAAFGGQPLIAAGPSRTAGCPSTARAATERTAPTPAAQTPGWPMPLPAAEAGRTDRNPYPAPVVQPPTAPMIAELSGSPDAAPRSALPLPVVRPSAPTDRPPTAAPVQELVGSPDEPNPAHARATQTQTSVRAASGARRVRSGTASYKDLVRQADEAAKAGDWGEVVRYTREGCDEDERLDALNRMAHAWAHDQLASCVKTVEQGEFASARHIIENVARQMRGEPEGVDAERGLEAIETVQHLSYLPGDSAVRRAVRKSMYDKMRGTRWAPLFSDSGT